MLSRDVAGALTVVVVAGLFVVAWRLFRAGREAAALACVVAAGFLLRAFVASDFFLHEWDERYHALVAKNLAQHPFVPTLYDRPLLRFDYREWTSNHIWLHKEPLALWAMAASIKVFGANELAVRLPSLLISSAAIVWTHGIARALSGSALVAFVAAGLHAINGKLVELAAGRTATDHVDTMFISLVGAGVWLAVRRRHQTTVATALGIGLLAGLAALSKSILGLLVLALWVIVAHTGQRPSGTERSPISGAWLRVLGLAGLAAAVAFAVYLPWHIYIDATFPAEATWERTYNFLHVTEALEGHAGSIFYHLAEIPRLYGELALLSLIWFFWRFARRQRDRERAVLALWIAVPYVIFSIAKTKMPAYPLLAAPAIFTVVAWHVDALRDVARRRTGWRHGLAIAATFLLLALPVRYAIERSKPLGGPDWTTAWATSLRGLARHCLDAETVIFHAARPIETMFYSDAIAYPHLPSDGDLTAVTRQGYRAVVVDDDALPAWLRNDARIEVLPRDAAACAKAAQEGARGERPQVMLPKP